MVERSTALATSAGVAGRGMRLASDKAREGVCAIAVTVGASAVEKLLGSSSSSSSSPELERES